MKNWTKQTDDSALFVLISTGAIFFDLYFSKNKIFDCTHFKNVFLENIWSVLFKEIIKKSSDELISFSLFLNKNTIMYSF